jgi:hypothetical protein
MARTMKAERWPNKSGWTVKVAHGEAEVWDHVSRLAVRAPIAPRREWVESPLRGRPRWVEVDRQRICFVPLGTDPVEAVRLCLRDGLAVDVSGGDGERFAVPTLSPEPALLASP